MKRYAYQKTKGKDCKKIFRYSGLIVFILGLFLIIYISYPLLSWKVYFAPDLEQNNIIAPIPKAKIINSSTLKSLLSTSANSILGIDYSNAQMWFPGFSSPPKNAENKINYYKISIPKLGIQNAVVSAVDNDLSMHLVNYPGTPVPPEKGNSVIFGHSTLPQLFNQNDYKTIFANAYKLKNDDKIYVMIDNISYLYKINNITVVSPEDTSVFMQNNDDSYLTLVTCTPPGTTWKRLVIKSKLEKI